MKSRNEQDRHHGMNGILPRSVPAIEFNCECRNVHVFQNIEQFVRMVAQIRKKRMLCYDFTCVSFLLPVTKCSKRYSEE